MTIDRTKGKHKFGTIVEWTQAELLSQNLNLI